MHPIIKRGLHWTGSGIALAGIAFVILRLRSYSSEIDFSCLGVAKWSVVLGMSLIYSLTNLMLALAWKNLLGRFDANISYLRAIKIYGISQLAKYVPGNICHLAGRQAMGLAAGISGWSLVKSSIWELGLISSTGGLFGVLVIPLLIEGVPVSTGMILFTVTVGLTAAIVLRIFGPLILRAFNWYVAFLAVSGILFIGLLELVSTSHLTKTDMWPTLAGAYVLAWLAGLITPGAPAGVGIREMVLLFLLKGIVNEADLLLAVILGRLVTVTGDSFFFGAASMLATQDCQRD